MEKKIALIPKVMMNGAFGPKEYGVLLTDRRMIFVLERTSKIALVGVIGDALLADKRTVDYENEDLNGLVDGERNMAVEHTSIQHIRLGKGLLAYTLVMDYTDPNGKSKKVKAMLIPPSEMIARRKAEGVDRGAANEEYAKSARAALERAIPPTIALRGEWDV